MRSQGDRPIAHKLKHAVIYVRRIILMFQETSTTITLIWQTNWLPSFAWLKSRQTIHEMWNDKFNLSSHPVRWPRNQASNVRNERHHDRNAHEGHITIARKRRMVMSNSGILTQFVVKFQMNLTSRSRFKKLTNEKKLDWKWDSIGWSSELELLIEDKPGNQTKIFLAIQYYGNILWHFTFSLAVSHSWPNQWQR